MVQDLFVTACEGGINYWADVSNYDFVKITATVLDIEDRTEYNVNACTIIDGVLTVADSLRYDDTYLALMQEIQHTTYDAIGADIVLQMGIFGELIYG
jgi:hypothetical protein